MQPPGGRWVLHPGAPLARNVSGNDENLRRTASIPSGFCGVLAGLTVARPRRRGGFPDHGAARGAADGRRRRHSR